MMTDKLLIDRELLEQICVELEHDNDRYMLGRELRKALALPAAPADGEAVEEAKVVSYLSACTDGYDPDAPHPGPPEPLMTVAQHQRIMAAAVPAGCKAVPVDLIERTICRLTHGHEHDKAVRELRALLASAEGVKS